MTRALPPIQSEIEDAQRDFFKRNDIKAVAAHLDVDQSYVSKLLDPDDPQHRSPLYVFERFIYACDMERIELGDAHVVKFLTDRSGWTPRQDSDAIPPEIPASMFQFLQAAVAKLPQDVQMRYLDAAFVEYDRFKRGETSELEDNVQSIKRK